MDILLKNNKCLLKVVSLNLKEGYGTFLKLNNPNDEEGSILINHVLIDDFDIKTGRLIEGFELYKATTFLTEEDLLIYKYKIYIADSKLLEIITNYKELYEKVKDNKIEPIANGVYIYLKTISDEINELGVSDRFVIETLLKLNIENL